MKISDSEGSYMDSYEADYTSGEDVFADVHNLDHCIKYLNQSLVSIAKTCNCLYAMIQQRQRDIEYRETANDTRQRLMSDMSRLETKMERLSDQLSIKEREMQTMASKEQKLTTSFKTQLEKLQLEKDELQRMLIATQQVRSQQNHELKKKEKEYVKLQERLNQVVMEKKKESKNGIEIMNLLQKEGRQRGTWNAKKADGDFYKMIVDAYESKKQDLVAENADLRALLRSMQADMRDFLNTSNGSSRPGNITNGSVELESPPTPLGGRTDVFDLPFYMARDQIEQSLRAKMSSIKERMMQLQEGQKEGQAGDSCVRKLQLEDQLAEACSIIDEQDTLITEDLPDPEENSDYLKEPQLSEETNAFTCEENTAGRERIENIAASKDSSKERNELDNAQQKLADEQASWTSAVTSMAPALRGHSGQKQDVPEVAIACPESLINDKEPAESRTATITPENKSPCVLDIIPIAPQKSEVGSPRSTTLADPFPHVKYYANPWLDPLIWEKICAPIETLSSSQEDHCVQLNNQELEHEALDLGSSSVWSKFSFATIHSSGGLCDPPRFESYEEFEHWIARSAFGGRHDETMVMLQRTQTVAIGPAVSNNESRFTEIA